MLQARNITVTLGRAEVLHDIAFDAAPGQLTAICGPNGSGKTTLLRAMTGDLPHDGRITLNGAGLETRAPWELAAIRGVLPQASALAFPFTVLEVVEIGLSRGRSGGDPEAAMQALARVDLDHYATRPYQALSGGEQQRAQLARVLAQVAAPVAEDGPRWLFLDEPVSALDIAHQLDVMQIARDFADAGGGVVAVMHDLNLTAMFADRVALLAGGHVLAAGPAAEVMTSETLSRAYGCRLRVGAAPPPGTPFLLPQAAARAAD
ncbi:heme ABC transporter ATP-binding protein [Salipiger sp. P9]|uniref:heme ABC transporter ATP-binding protein n=1 Tax=Salipiger pentaromativorans TaxID=2943193 RepID=UPI002156F6FF|nr:heme ABC transporter ATP-binding protein [Salipiger pentaromativorans]MCR8546717.1 heme ABC transporter ATP-binding protein [Salipiger pentaromativorans]